MRTGCFLLVLVLALLITLPCFADDTQAYRPVADYDKKQEGVAYYKLEAKSYFSKTCGKIRDVLVYLPPEYNPDAAYPVLYLLHGIGGNHLEWTGGVPDVILGNLLAAGEAKEMIVVTPNIKAFPAGTPSSGNMYSPETFAAFDNFINDLRDDLMPFIKENYSVLEGREYTAVAGLSMGGREALYIGLSMQDTFGYVGAFAPAPGVLPYFAEGGLFTEESFRLEEQYETFVMIVAGTTDTTVGEWPKTYSDTLTKNGSAHVFYETQGGHNFFVWKNGLYNFARNIFGMKAE